MSDIRKWLKLMESVHPVVATPPTEQSFERDDTVILGANVGGGVGRFVQFTAEGAALIDVKGVTREFASSDFAVPERDLANGNDWFHMSVTDDTPGTSNDNPEFRPGDMIKIADVYGTVIGPGFGVFIGYGTTGRDCIVLFDGKQIVVPIENVASVLEQDAKDNFDQMDNDGNLSPMSFGSDNVKIEQPQNCGMQSREPAMDQRDEFSKWMDTVEEALRDEGKTELEEMIPPPTNACGCGSWSCEVCFPSHTQHEEPMQQPEAMPATDMDGECPTCGHSHEDGQHDMEGFIEIGPEDGELDMDPTTFGMEEEDDNEPDMPLTRERGSDGKGVKLGDIVQKFVPTDAAGEESPLTHGDDLEEEIPQDANPDDYGKAGRYSQEHFGKFEEMKYPLGLRREEQYAYRQGYENPRDTPEDWEFKSNSMEGEAFYRGRSDRIELSNEIDEDDDVDFEDDMAADAYHKTMQGSPKSEEEVEQALDMISEIKYMQNSGLSMAERGYSEDEMANMGFDELQKILAAVRGEVTEEMPDMGQDDGMGADMGMGGAPTGGGGQYAPGTAPTMPESIQQGKATMENVDKDVAAMLASLKRYDTLKESVAPVLGMKTLGEKKKPDFPDLDKDGDKKETMAKALKDKEEVDESEDKNPWEKLASDKEDKEDKGPKAGSTHKTAKGGTVTKTEKGLKHVKEEVEEADADVLQWMSRFSKLGNMKGYGR